MWQSAVHLAGRIMPLQSDPKHDLLKQVKERDKTTNFFRQSIELKYKTYSTAQPCMNISLSLALKKAIQTSALKKVKTLTVFSVCI